ncbi:ABC transporter permease [Bradyrhizobium liaoningense]|uniref:ABC transporter permease n=1 Tax=Bradyrhizobium liaoningense TaxID=43992 RepID=UPI001BADF61C|nr:ABC transporter permease [Bradyrhizobium liaoningense]MBR0856670.1 ABC transporter permease [Bradyrhizobium liaoningense]
MSLPEADTMQRAATRTVISPSPGGAFSVAFSDVEDAVRLSSVWLHSGWIDIIWRFRRTRIGPFWHTLTLAFFVLVMGVLWSTILKQDPSHYFRYVTAGMIVWGLIASFITEGASILVSGQATALSMRFPYVAFAFGHVWRSLLLFTHQFVFYVLVMVATQTSPGWVGLLAIPAMALVIANGVWISLLVGIICLRWRDLVPATASIMQIAVFATPVFWPRDMLGANLGFAADLNPLFHLVRILRDPLLGTPPPPVSWLWCITTLIVGMTLTLWIYGKRRHRLPYWY